MNCSKPGFTITASQGRNCAIIQTEFSVFRPDESANASSLLNHMRIHMNALSILSPSLGVLNQYFRLWGFWWKKLLLTLGNIFWICAFSCMYLCYCSIVCLQCRQRAFKWATSILVTPLADSSDHISKKEKRSVYVLVRRSSMSGRSLRSQVPIDLKSWAWAIKGSLLLPLSLVHMSLLLHLLVLWPPKTSFSKLPCFLLFWDNPGK